mmetsp:Transcript_43410/g.72115  ORF Transcript_43410/g.72115 Transcript_43410/m.72115 type:complete len:228 (+) Transcript_43410:71-754(+)
MVRSVLMKEATSSLDILFPYRRTREKGRLTHAAANAFRPAHRASRPVPSKPKSSTWEAGRCSQSLSRPLEPNRLPPTCKMVMLVYSNCSAIEIISFTPKSQHASASSSSTGASMMSANTSPPPCKEFQERSRVRSFNCPATSAIFFIPTGVKVQSANRRTWIFDFFSSRAGRRVAMASSPSCGLYEKSKSATCDSGSIAASTTAFKPAMPSRGLCGSSTACRSACLP